MSRVVAIAALWVGLVSSSALAAEGGGGFINLDKSLLIQAVNFGLLLLVLIKLLYRPLLGMMDERTRAIKKALEEAEAARAETQREREEHAVKIQAAYAEAQAIRAAASCAWVKVQRKSDWSLRRSEPRQSQYRPEPSSHVIRA